MKKFHVSCFKSRPVEWALPLKQHRADANRSCMNSCRHHSNPYFKNHAKRDRPNLSAGRRTGEL